MPRTGREDSWAWTMGVLTVGVGVMEQSNGEKAGEFY